MPLKLNMGCFTRPYDEYSFERALRGIASAGFRYVGLMHPGMLVPSMTEAEVGQLQEALQRNSLIPLATWAEFHPDALGTSNFTKVIDTAHQLKIRTILTAGPWPYLEGIVVRKPTGVWMKEVDDYIQSLRVISSYADSKGVEIALKPHAGITATAKECLDTMKLIDRENVRIWYDPGNVVYYEGLRPEDTPDDLRMISKYVTGLCAKDIIGGRGGTIVVPGKGEIAFGTLFKVLLDMGFEGPCLVETSVDSGTAPDVIDAILQSSHDHLRATIAQL